MKTVVILFVLIQFTLCAGAQSGDPKVDAMLKELHQQQKSNASIQFTFNKINYVDKASFVETDKKNYALTSSLINDETPETSVCILLPKKQSGTQPLINGSFVIIKSVLYELRGTASITLKKNSAKGTFKGQLFLVTAKGAKAAATSSGEIKGQIN
jgi:hypothetical protein